jgi:hypothetical protein
MKKIYVCTFIAAFIVMAAVFTACPTDGGSDGGGGGDPVYLTIANTAQWNAAVNQIKTGGNGKSYVLTIADTVPVPPTSANSLTFGVTGLTVTLKGSGALALNANGALFSLWGSSASARQTLVIDGPVTLKGRNADDNGVHNVGPVVLVNDYAALEMKNGTITGNNNNASNSKGGGVFVDGGSLAMSGGEISGNTAYNGGGVQVTGGSFTMSGGKISGNTGSGADVSNGGSFAMSGGEISGNLIASSGVSVSVGASFTLSGNGKISDNSNMGVYVNGGSFAMSGGVISGNTAGSGAGVYVNNNNTFSNMNGTFAKSGGIIYGDNNTDHTAGADENTATTGNGHAVYLYGTSAKKRNADADASVKLYAKYNGTNYSGSWTYDGIDVDGINADTTDAWE